MIILRRGKTTKENLDKIIKEITEAGLKAKVVKGDIATTVSVIGDESTKGELFRILASYNFVERAVPVQDNIGYRIIAREHFDQYRNNLKTIKFKVNNVEIGNGKPIIIAGPCAVHSKEQILELAQAVKEAGAHMFRGGAFKPRTSPYDFQGLGYKGLEILAEARERTGLPIVTEIMDSDMKEIELVGQYADVMQVGARNMQNFSLLKKLGKYATENDRAVLLKTSLLPNLRDVLCAAEYLAYEGAQKIILCERGMAITLGATRNTPNPTFLHELRKKTYLPVIGDPSHSTGDAELVTRTANQYLSMDANGLIIEVKRDNEKPKIDGIAVCDFKQSIPVSEFRDYMNYLTKSEII